MAWWLKEGRIERGQDQTHTSCEQIKCDSEDIEINMQVSEREREMLMTQNSDLQNRREDMQP